jgi:hypothetical protein
MGEPLNLGDAFDRIAHKRVALVDLPRVASHQHEVNGVAALRDFFATSETIKGPITWIRFADDAESVPEVGEFTFYDARARSADRTGRAEWRLYYTGEPLAGARAGDLLVVARAATGEVFALVFEQGSGWERAALVLFPIPDAGDQVRLLSQEVLCNTELDLVRRSILEQLEIDFVVPEPDLEGIVIERFGFAFPSTAQMSEFARERIPAVGATADDALWAWLDMEERLFRALERVIVGDRLDRPFESVDEFLSYSLSVQNRRKSRMGHALENHLAAVFDRHAVRYSSQVRTEGNRTADFVFPGAAEYRDATFPIAHLTVLAAKSTCKDRWPQVLADADRVPAKHLCTLDTTLSGFQIGDMATKGVLPVMPARVLAGYAGVAGAGAIIDITGFVQLVRARG